MSEKDDLEEYWKKKYQEKIDKKFPIVGDENPLDVHRNKGKIKWDKLKPPKHYKIKLNKFELMNNNKKRMIEINKKVEEEKKRKLDSKLYTMPIKSDVKRK